MLFCAFSAAFLRPEFSVVFAAVSLFGAVGFFLFGRKFYRIAVFFIAAALGFGITALKITEEIYPAAALDGHSAEITGKVTGISAAGGNPIFTVKTDSVGIEGAPQEITVGLTGWGENSAEPFDLVKCKVTFRVYSETDLSETLSDRSDGLSIYAYLDSPIEITGRDENSPGYFIYCIREKISSTIYKFFVGWHAPFAEQLLIGTRGELEHGISSAFRKSGMSHILAISGMHLVIITGITEKFFLLSKATKRKTILKYSFLIAFVAVYMLVGGFGMSLVRSGAMLIVSYFAKIFFSGSKSLDNFGIAVILVLIFNPFAACDSGFLMSVFSCAAISAFAKPLSDYLSRLLKLGEHSKFRYFTDTFSTSSAAFLSVLPISALAFEEISLAAPFSNLFAGFFAHYSLIFSFLTVLLGFFPFLSFISGGTAFIAMVCNSIMLRIAEFFAEFSFLYIETDDFWFFIWILCAAVLIIVPALCSGGFRYIKHSLVMSVLALVFGILLDFVFFSGVSEINVTALEHGTAISCSKGGETVLVTHSLGSSDRFELDDDTGKYSVFISIDAVSDAAEHDIVENFRPETAYLSSEDLSGKAGNHSGIFQGTLTLGENEIVTVYNGAVSFETNGVTLLYIFEECDIMNINPKFRRPDILIMDGVSPEKYPSLRSGYLILRKSGGFYSGSSEIITLRSGDISFFAHEGNLRKGWPAG